MRSTGTTYYIADGLTGEVTDISDPSDGDITVEIDDVFYTLSETSGPESIENDIATNTANIATNTGDIDDLQNDKITILQSVATSNDTTLDDVALLTSTGTYTGEHYFYLVSSQATFYCSTGITDTLTSYTDNSDGTITATGGSGSYTLTEVDSVVYVAVGDLFGSSLVTGDLISTGITKWECITDSPTDYTGLKPLSPIYGDDFGLIAGDTVTGDVIEEFITAVWQSGGNGKFATVGTVTFSSAVSLGRGVMCILITVIFTVRRSAHTIQQTLSPKHI